MMQTWPMIGRDPEAATIMHGLKQGVGAVVVGDAGAGKSLLVVEVARRLNARGWLTEFVACCGRSDFPRDRIAARPAAAAATARVLVVDDAHLLDEESADTLWRLAHESNTHVVATIRAGERTPDRIVRLWSGGPCERLELAPLTEADVRRLLEVVLEGDVEDRLPRQLIARAAGNALLLRELVRAGVTSGAIVRKRQVWRLAKDLPVGAGAADMIRHHLSELSPSELAAAQLLAVGEPLSIPVADSVIGTSLMEALEDRQVAAVADTLGGPVLNLAHPLFGEVLRTDIAALRLRRLRRELLAGFARAGSMSQRDLLRSVVWRLDIGEPPARSELIAAASAARLISLSTAERLARAAVGADTTVEATVLLAEIMIVQGRIAEADSLLDGLDLDSLSTEDRDTVTYGRALVRTRRGELGDVISMITGTDLGSTMPSPQLQAIYGQALMLDGRIDEATTVVQALLEDPDSDPVTRTIAACGIAAGGAFTGRADDSARVMRDCMPAAEAALAAVPFGVSTLMVATAIAQAGAGRLADAEKIGQRLYDRALADDDEWSRPRGASALGVTALLRGQVRTAIRYFRVTVVSLNELDGQYSRYNLSYLARGAAVAGYVEEAQQALESATDGPDFLLFRGEWLIAEAAVLAAQGDLAAATERALVAARHAASLGQWATVSAAAHDAARYTAAPEAVQLTATAADWVDGSLGSCVARYARARGAGNPAELSNASTEFERLGTLLYAAEAAYAAARAYRHIGDGRAAARATVRASTMHAQCENAAIPWAAGFQTGELLTPREQQIALHAAAGRPDATIAAEMNISVRTVQNHLARAYRKLAITNRRDLANALPHDTPPS